MVQADSHLIRQTRLGDGGVKLHLFSRSETTDVTAPSGPRSLKARVITMAWGERYIADLLATTVPALLAPGNLPAFCSRFSTELVIVTELRLFDRIKRDPSVLRALEVCDVRLLPIDDLLCPHYGMTLTYAMVRGFADLGPAITDTHLIFLNSDFILADGSYRTLADKIESGERLVVSPSYCMELEPTISVLRKARDPRTQAIALAPRTMADLILKNRHNTIRAKTINQRLFRMHRYDQFYWHVNDHTLLARQMPIAVVYMRPERALTELQTFWDYGLLSEYCPTLKPCVLGDSDDFLIAELRTKDTFREFFHLGWADATEIAADLATFTTKDHRDYGRYNLCLHSGVLPDDIGEHVDNLGKFVDSVYDRLPPPVDFRNHAYWEAAYRRFLPLREKQRRELLALLSQQQEECEELSVDTLTATGAEEEQQPAPPADASADFTARHSRLGNLYGKIFGYLPSTNPGHPYHTVLKPVVTAIDAAQLSHESRSLVVSSGGAIFSRLASSLPGKKISITLAMAKEHLYTDLIDGKKFDFCLCGITFGQLFQIKGILVEVYPLLKPNGRIVIFFQNTDGVQLDPWTPELAEGLFPAIGTSRITFSGSLPGSLASRWYASVLDRFRGLQLRGMIERAVALTVCGALGLVATMIERNRKAGRLPPHCTGMTIEISLNSNAGKDFAGT